MRQPDPSRCAVGHFRRLLGRRLLLGGGDCAVRVRLEGRHDSRLRARNRTIAGALVVSFIHSKRELPLGRPGAAFSMSLFEQT